MTGDDYILDLAARNGRLVEVVLEAVSEATGEDRLTLPPLYEAVDPEALETLVRAGANVAFRYAEFVVSVTEEAVRLSDPDEASLTETDN